LDFFDAAVPRENRHVGVRANEGESGCLNWNLMVPKSHLPTLAFDDNSKADNVSSFVRGDNGFVTT
jgi:hypothetical protein